MSSSGGTSSSGRPYDPTSRPRLTLADLDNPLPSQEPPPEPERPRTYREMNLQTARVRFPTFNFRDDFDIISLAGSRYTGSLDEAEVYAWLDKERARYIAENGSLAKIEEIMDATLAGFFGSSKKRPVEHSVHIRSIPGSPYSIRLWPGSISQHEYCVDLIKKRGNKPTEFPSDHALCRVPNPAVPSYFEPIPLKPMEQHFSIPESKMLPGPKYIVAEGMECVLTRGTQRNVRFVVPRRHRVEVSGDECFLDFPALSD